MRSFTAVSISNPPSPDRAAAPSLFPAPVVPVVPQEERHMSFYPRRRQSYNYQLPNMPVAGSQAYQTQFPSFMSVYDLDVNPYNSGGVVVAAEKQLATCTLEDGLPLKHQDENERILEQQTLLSHQHHNSTSTQDSIVSESTDSSPTTTISTADSSSLTDPSPSSSPESPVTVIPLSSFSATTLGIHSLDDIRMSDSSPPLKSPLQFDRPMSSPPPKRPRNLKGLALALPSSVTPLSAVTPLSTVTSPIHETAPSRDPCLPSSNSFVKPPLPKPRKKPSILSLQTPANPSPFARLALDMPPTPGLSRPSTLRTQSSPQMLFSTDSQLAFAPQGGMQVPALERSKISGLSSVFRKPSNLKEIGTAMIEEDESPIRTQMATRSNTDIRGDIFDAPASQEDAKSPGYPNGPVEIYEPCVYLYSEPTAEEASNFDVIVNVASEVKNPFTTTSNAPTALPPPQTTFGSTAAIDREAIPVPDTGASLASFRTAFEFQSFESQQTPTESPTTPKPVGQKTPEYIHVPWEHTTDISMDLMHLCKTIDSRVKEGKKVLVHCQQGASRSASLIIAYGLYCNPSLSVNDAYVAAQGKSKWISPNMKLMYALQDFKKDLENTVQGGGAGAKRATGRRLSASMADYKPKEAPPSAPLPAQREISSGSGMSRERGNSSPGPSSAPSRFEWPRSDSTSVPRQVDWSSRGFPSLVVRANPSSDLQSSDHDCLQMATTTITAPTPIHFSRPPPSLAPLSERRAVSRQMATPVPPTPGLWSPRIQEMTGMGFPRLGGDATPDDVPATPTLFSPRAFTFSAAALSVGAVSAAPLLAVGTVPAADPRSPATKGEAPIIRSIDDMI